MYVYTKYRFSPPWLMNQCFCMHTLFISYYMMRSRHNQTWHYQIKQINTTDSFVDSACVRRMTILTYQTSHPFPSSLLIVIGTEAVNFFRWTLSLNVLIVQWSISMINCLCFFRRFKSEFTLPRRLKKWISIKLWLLKPHSRGNYNKKLGLPHTI